MRPPPVPEYRLARFRRSRSYRQRYGSRATPCRLPDPRLGDSFQDVLEAAIRCLIGEVLERPLPYRNRIGGRITTSRRIGFVGIQAHEPVLARGDVPLELSGVRPRYVPPRSCFACTKAHEGLKDPLVWGVRAWSWRPETFAASRILETSRAWGWKKFT